MTEPRKAWFVVAAIVIGLGLLPVAWRRDSYPVSDLPMFSTPRGRVTPVVTAVAVTEGDDVRQEWRLDPHRLAGTDEVIEAATVVRRAVTSGQADRLCREIADRVAQSGPGEAEIIEVVTEYIDAIDWFDGPVDPEDRVVHSICTVERSAS